jgi:O-antigen ligase
MVAISLIVLPISTIGFELPKFVVAATFSFCGALYLLLKGQKTADILLGSPAGKFLLLFVVALIGSIFWSVAPIMSIVGAAPRYQGVLFQVSLIAIALLIANVARTHKGLRATEDAFVISNILVVSYGVLQMMQIDPLQFLWISEAFLGRIFSTLGHPNALSQFVLLTLPFVLRRLCTANVRIHAVVWAAITLLNVIVVLGSVSRSGLLGLGFIVLIYLPEILQTGKSCTKFVSKISLSIFALILALSLAVGSVFFVERFSRAPIASRSTSARSVMWSGAMHMVAARPLGYGVETLSIVSPQFIGKEIYEFESLTTVVDRLHNKPLDLLVSVGLLGFIGYYGLLFSLLYAFWKKRADDNAGFGKSSAAALAAYSVALLFGFGSVATAVFFWAVVGLGLGAVGAETTRRNAYSTVCNLLLVMATCITVIIAVQWTKAQLFHAAAGTMQGQESLAYRQEGIMAFQFDRQALMETTEKHIVTFSERKSEEVESSIVSLLAMHKRLSGGHDGVQMLLQSWFHAEKGEGAQARQLIVQAKELLPESITYHRTALFIAGVLEDKKLQDLHSQALQDMLPELFWDKESETRRILLKQHPWLLELTLETER